MRVFQTVDTDLSFADDAVEVPQSGGVYGFRPLTRIYLLLTGGMFLSLVSIFFKFQTVDTDLSFADRSCRKL